LPAEQRKLKQPTAACRATPVGCIERAVPTPGYFLSGRVTVAAAPPAILRRHAQRSFPKHQPDRNAPGSRRSQLSGCFDSGSREIWSFSRPSIQPASSSRRPVARELNYAEVIAMCACE